MTDNSDTEARASLLQTIDLQLEAIDDGDFTSDDHAQAFEEFRKELEEWKEDIEAGGPISLSILGKRSAEEVEFSTPGPKRRLGECSSCCDTIPVTTLARLRCCHERYCKPCFEEWFNASLATRVLPRCCDDVVDPKEYTRWLSAGLKARYRTLKAELDAERKLYCSNPSCGKLIKIDPDASGFQRCGSCRRQTCASCWKGWTAHRGRMRACQTHLDDTLLEEAIKDNEFMRCPKCYVIVQKIDGCNNVTCNQCHQIFCYRCGVGKHNEGDLCKCSPPQREFVAVAEEPIAEEVAVSVAPVRAFRSTP